LNALFFFFVAIALLFAFLNGFHDSASVVATAIASRAIPPRWALVLTTLANLVGPFLFGVAVATTVGHDVMSEQTVTVPVAMSAFLSAIIWIALTRLLGIPSSSSHALLGGFAGAAIAGFGLGVVHLAGLYKVILGLFVSPVIGLFLGWFTMRQMLFIGRMMSPHVNFYFRRTEWVTILALGLSHGTNDAQKTMGILVMGLVAFGVLPGFHIPLWVIVANATAIGLGTALGGWRLLHTMGSGLYRRIRAIHAFSSQIASTVVILGMTLLGAPVSTTQVIRSSILGAGTAQRAGMVRWSMAGEILLAWILTIPSTGLLGALTFWLLRQIIR
jgi:PiT family inorganic phosphate transporter